MFVWWRKGASVASYFDDNRPPENYAATSVRGGAVSVCARGITAAIQIALVLFLARLLSPRDFGLVGMATAFVGFAPLLTDLGIQDAITQRPRITQGEVSALFWITLAVGCGFAVIAAASGPIIARFYGEPQLTMIVFVCSLTFVGCALTVQHAALMRRALMFRELGLIEIAASALSAIGAIALAFNGVGYWALVARQVGTPIFFSIGVWLTCRWVPGRPSMTAGVRDLLKFGLNIAGFGMVDFGGRSADRIVIGWRTNAAIVGQYQNAVLVMENLGSILVAPLHSVAVASLSKIRDNFSELRAAWAKALSTLTFVAMPTFGLLAVVSRDLTVLLFGPKWVSAGELLSLFAFRGIPQSVERTAGWLHVSAGRTDRLMRYGVLSTCVQLLALACGAPFGPVGIVISYVISMFVMFIPAVTYAGRPFNLHSFDVIAVVWRQLVGTLVSTVLGFALRWTLLVHTQPLVSMALLTMAYIASYLIIVIGMLRLRAPIKTVQLLIRRQVPVAAHPF